jgi:hypothetical protein
MRIGSARENLSECARQNACLCGGCLHCANYPRLPARFRMSQASSQLNRSKLVLPVMSASRGTSMACRSKVILNRATDPWHLRVELPAPMIQERC